MSAGFGLAIVGLIVVLVGIVSHDELVMLSGALISAVSILLSVRGL